MDSSPFADDFRRTSFFCRFRLGMLLCLVERRQESIHRETGIRELHLADFAADATDRTFFPNLSAHFMVGTVDYIFAVCIQHLDGSGRTNLSAFLAGDAFCFIYDDMPIGILRNGSDRTDINA